MPLDIDWAYIANSLAYLSVGVFLGRVWGLTACARREAHRALEEVEKLTTDHDEHETHLKTEDGT